jgi:hypothetical protein
MGDQDKKIILSIVAQNENQALQANADFLGAWLATYGYHYQLIDMFKPSGGDELLNVLQGGQVAFAFAYAGVGSRLELSNGINIWTASRTPFVSLWFDHPAYNYRQHIIDSPFVAHAYHVRDHLEMRNKFLPISSSASVLLPVRFGVSTAAHNHPIADRRKRILYAKTGKNPETIVAQWQRHSLTVQNILKELSELAVKNRNLDLTAVAQSLINSHSLDVSNLDLFMGIVQEVDDYVRVWRSDRLARALLPFPVDIVGRGWDYLRTGRGIASFLPPVSFYDFTQKLFEYRVIANSSPLWRDGIHERASHAISYGSILLTDRTEKSDAYFVGLPNYCAFEWDDDISDVIAMSMKLAEEDNADYLPVAEEILVERVISKTPNYADSIFKIVDEMSRVNSV